MTAFPVQPADRFFLLFEGLGPPVTAMWAFDMADAQMDPARFSGALQKACARHPKAACHRSGPESLVWQPLPGADERACVVHQAAEAGDPAFGLDTRLLQVVNSPLDSVDGPLVQMHWVPRTDGSATLGFRFHHALSDGFGSLPFFRDFLDFYNGASPRTPPPDYTATPPPQVPGSRLDRLRLFGRLLAFHFRRSSSYRFAPPAKLFDLRRSPGARIEAARRIVPAEKLARYLAAAKDCGASFNDLLVAAHGLAIDRWMSERGLRCGTLRIMINQNLRPRDGRHDLLENRSAAFPVWIGPRDRQLGSALVKRVHDQVQECMDLHIAEGTALLGGLLKLPLWLARRLVLPAATRPRISDSLIISNLGRLPESSPATGFLFGSSPFSAAATFVRPPDGVGLLSFALTLGSELSLSWCYLTGLFERAEILRGLDLLEAALEQLAAGSTLEPTA